MKWNNIKPDILASNISRMTTGWSFIDIVGLVNQTADYPLIIIPDRVYNSIIQHLNSKKVELGGLLVGSVVSTNDLTEGLIAIVIRESIPSNNFEATSVSLTMQPDVWQSASQISDTETFVVGWYHSHPNLGAFFSGVDRKTQKDFFNSAYSLGLVIDPVRHEEKWFIGAESAEINSDNIKTCFGDLSI
ncbi:MAG: Mov34/MPN/PAD-1 family protein [Endozoicomonadaceae bacterium]|nr:Mov34/MPN/PAD-1 family protein [Endozoicomonadaceae bacterium]